MSSFLKGVIKMADIDIDLFGDHDKTGAQPDKTGETIPLIPGGVGGATWEPEREQETSFGGKTQRTRLTEVQVEGLHQKLTEITCQTPEAFHFDDFELRDAELYYKGKGMPLMIRGKLRSVGVIAEILGKEGLSELGFKIPLGNLTARQAIMLNRVEEELPSISDIAKADNIGLREITENASKITEDLITQLDNQTHPSGDSLKHPL